MLGFGKSNRLRVSSASRMRALTAAGERTSGRDGDKLQRLIQPWQMRAYGYYDTVPEIKFAAQFYSRMLAPLRLFAAEIDDQGEIKETDNAKVIEQVERIQDPGGGRTSLLGTYGRLRFLGGETLCCVTLEKDDDQEQWEMLSPAELRKSPGGSGWMRLRAPSLPPEQYKDAPDDAFEPMNDDEVVVYRLWQRHPVYSELADSTMQAVLEVAEELLLLSRGVRNRARSRFATAGILLVNGEVTVVGQQGGDVADENPEEDPFLKELYDATTTAIADEGSASAVVPIVVRVDVGKDESLDNVMKHLQIVDPTQLYPEQGLRREAIERLAIGLDMPPEVLLGIGGANHWSGWLVDDQSWKQHGQPVAQGFVDDLTAAFLRPTLREEKIEDWKKYLIGFDPAAVINHPDRSKDAKDLHDRGALSDEALREAAGFDDDDTPSDEEKQNWLGIQLRDSSVAIDGIPSVKAGGIEPQPGELITRAGTVDSGDSPANVVKGTPDQPSQPAEPAAPPAVTSSAALSRILGASDLALLRARELAGARLRNFAKRDPEALAAIDGVQAGQVAATLGRERADALGAPPARELVRGRPLLADTLRLSGIDASLAEPLGDRLEQHAAKTLFDAEPGPLPASFENYVRGLGA